MPYIWKVLYFKAALKSMDRDARAKVAYLAKHGSAGYPIDFISELGSA